MFALSKNIKIDNRVWSWRPTENGIVLCVDKELVFSVILLVDQENKVINDFAKGVCYLKTEDDVFFLQQDNARVIEFNLTSLKCNVIELDNQVFINKIQENYLVATPDKELGRYVAGMLQNKSVKYKFQNAPLFYFFKEKKCLIGISDEVADGKNKKKLMRKFERYDIETGKMLWQVDVSGLGRYEEYVGKWNDGTIARFIGCYEETLLVALKGPFLLFVNISNGEVKTMLKKSEEEKSGKVHDKFLHAEFGTIDKRNKKLRVLHNWHYIQVDLEHYHIEHCINLEDDIFLYKEKKLRAIMTTFSYPYFYFTADWQHYGFLRYVVGAFNVEKISIEWIYEFDEGCSLTGKENSIQYDGGKLYVLDGNNIMHVFEPVK